MRKIYLACLVAVAAMDSYSQTSVSRVYIHGGRNAWDNYRKEVYEYPAFEKGIVEYRDGKRYQSLLNYNKVLGTIQFIDEKGDTLAILNETSVSTISIGSDTYYFTPACLKELAGNDKVKLAKNERIRIADKQKMGAMGIPNSTGTIESMDRTDQTRNLDKIDVNEELLLRKTTTYYYGTSDNRFVTASKANTLELFPKEAEVLRKFIKEQSINFTKEVDLLRLQEYLGKL